MTSELMRAHEAERQRLAYAMHADIVQKVSAIKLATETTLHTGDVNQDGRDRLGMAVGLLIDVIEDIRAVTTRLRPSLLDDLGLVTAIHWLCRETGQLNRGMRILPSINVRDEEVPEYLKIVIFRILEDSLSDAFARGATSISIELGRAAEHLALRLADDGGDQTVDEAMSLFAAGLRRIRERASLSGGKFDAQPRSGAGTAVHVSWKLCH